MIEINFIDSIKLRYKKKKIIYILGE